MVPFQVCETLGLDIWHDVDCSGTCETKYYMENIGIFYTSKLLGGQDHTF
jgi:hypothetical protein